uniref:EGF-like domain-containing protein n=1 Tax=Magallana gigas TaxID=29159 RepID=A0A8W8NVK1_MAGGI
MKLFADIRDNLYLHCYNNTCDRFNGRCFLGCKDGFYGELCDREIVMKIQNVSISIGLIIGLSVSVLINLIFIVCGMLLCRRNKSINKTALDVSGNLLFCWKKSIYQDVVVKAEEGSTYQELNLSENAYQNVAVQ